MTWYKAGLISVAQGSTTVQGIGTAWVDNVLLGDGLRGPDGTTYEIVERASNTSMEIFPAYAGPTVAEQRYLIIPVPGRTKALADRASTMMDGLDQDLSNVVADAKTAAEGVVATATESIDGKVAAAQAASVAAEGVLEQTNVAAASAGTYTFRSEGLAVVAEGGYFWSPDGATAGYLGLWRKVSGAAVAQGVEQPLKSVFESVRSLSGVAAGAAARTGELNALTDVSRMALDYLGASGNPTLATYVGTANGMRVVTPANTRIWMMSTDCQRSGGVDRYRIAFTAEALPSAPSISFACGLAVGSGAARRMYLYLNTGIVARYNNDGTFTNLMGPSTGAGQAARAWAAGQSGGLQLDVKPDGSGTLLVISPDGVLHSVALAAAEVPAGRVAIAVRGNGTALFTSLWTEGYTKMAKDRIDEVDATAVAAKTESATALQMSGQNRAAMDRLLGFMRRPPPPGWDRWVPDFNIYRFERGIFFTDYDHESRRPFPAGTGTTYYVGFPGASDANNGAAEGTSFASLYKAIQGRTGNVEVIVSETGGDGAGRYNGVLGCRGAIMTGNLVIRSKNGGLVTTACQKTAALTWTLVPAKTRTYQATVSSIGAVVDRKRPDTVGYATHQMLVAALDDVETVAGSYFKATNTLYVSTADGRVPDEDIVVYDDIINGYYSASAGVLWTDGVVFEGGARPLYLHNTVETDLQVAYLGNGALLYGGGSADGNAITGRGHIRAYCYRMKLAESLADNLNWHALNGTSTASITAIEIECESYYAGHNTLGNNNASTSHEAGTVISIMPIYLHGQNRVVHDIDNSRRWILGGKIGYSRGTGSTGISVVAGTGSVIYMDEVELVGSEYDFNVGAGSAIYVNGVVSAGRLYPNSLLLLQYIPK
ncbi:hypothetical protein EC845_1206 [Comamonas sp. BIGb0124]|uniref:hypothetical protein n=1 Tax=Comamonas sp. BIGb0124 TaxID=2485130 RepID=UPI000F48D66B|nr:hypothetical protein [Comamonas sp. BIGb0124]ROR25166.1 hypothetical protein EC845_1206 [Comamonas sp. BIGb0124]